LSQGLQLLDDTTLITRWNTEVALIVREFMNAETDPRSHRDRVRVVIDHLDPNDTVACQIAMRCARSLTSTNQPHDALPITERFNANCDGVDTEGFSAAKHGADIVWIDDAFQDDHELTFCEHAFERQLGRPLGESQAAAMHVESCGDRDDIG